MLHQVVTLADDPRADRTDKYGRRLAYVGIGGIDVALHQLEAGYAVAYLPLGEPRPARHARYLNAEQTARTSRAGAWARCTSLGR